MDELEKIDLLRERLGITYREAKDALLQTDGDVVQALINLEKSKERWDDKLEEKGQEIIEYVKEIIKKGNVTKVRLKKKDKVVLEIPATVGALGIGGMLLSPILTALGVVGTVAAVVKDYTLEVVRPDGRVEQHDLKFLEGENSNDNEN
ncbi:MAG TPA: DUF4342 domain-containing protein [Clostridia bacterium]|jgi:hypothetical protein|nr:DUF4342 domain-containing protein [Clostridia bacterium]